VAEFIILYQAKLYLTTIENIHKFISTNDREIDETIIMRNDTLLR